MGDVSNTMVRTGLEVLLSDQPQHIQGQKIGLVTHQSAVTSDLQHAVGLLKAGRGWKLTTLFGPEHGIWGEAQDMAHVDHATDPASGLPVHSLYGKSEDDLKPRREILKTLDALVIDLQDVGTRVYTFAWTIQPPPGTSIGPLITCPPCASIRSRPFATNRGSEWGQIPTRIDSGI